jgi:hypothetical protein
LILWKKREGLELKSIRLTKTRRQD